MVQCFIAYGFKNTLEAEIKKCKILLQVSVPKM